MKETRHQSFRQRLLIHALMLFALGGWGAALAAPAHGDQPADAVAWLEKMVTAAKKLNYTGTFTYQSGGESETSRITHIVGAAGEFERLEVLDGSPREVVRNNDEIRCYLPDDKLVIVEKRRQHKAFPALLPASVGYLDEHYQIHMGETARVAGLVSQLVVLEPKDTLRYGYQLWADIDSGLLLKARMVDEHHGTIEQFAFSQIQIDGLIDKSLLKSRFDEESKTWRIYDARAAQSFSAGGDWQFKNPLPGFKKSAGMKRRSRIQNGGEVTHFVFTDGLASISVFIEPLGEAQRARQKRATYSAGAINVYKRVTGKHLLTILGEVPMASLKHLGDGMELRRK